MLRSAALPEVLIFNKRSLSEFWMPEVEGTSHDDVYGVASPKVIP